MGQGEPNLTIISREFIGQYDWGWVQQQIPLVRVQDTCGMMFIDEETNKTVGAAILDTFRNTSCHGHLIFTDNMRDKKVALAKIAEMVYETYSCNIGYVTIAANNKKSLDLCKFLGFKHKTNFKDGYADGIDYILMELNKHDCMQLIKKLEVA